MPKVILKTKDNQEIDITPKILNNNTNKVTVIQIDFNRYTKEIIQEAKIELEKYFPNVLVLDKRVKIKQLKITK